MILHNHDEKLQWHHGERAMLQERSLSMAAGLRSIFSGGHFYSWPFVYI